MSNTDLVSYPDDMQHRLYAIQKGKHCRRTCTATADGAAVRMNNRRKETKSTPINVLSANTRGPSLEETVR